MATSPSDREKLKSLLRWNREQFAKGGHSVGPCMRSLMREGMPRERAGAICARTKDMALGTTKWRKGGKKKG